MAGIGDNGGPMLCDGRRGWVAVSRDMRKHWLVGFGQPVNPADPEKDWVLSRSEAWIDLIMECRFDSGTVNNGGHKMVIQPGQLVGAVSWLAHRWNWTPKTVRGFLDKLENDGMIDRNQEASERGNQKGKQSSVVTVCNYSDYQVVDIAQGQTQGLTKGKQRANKGQTEGNIYKDNTGTLEQGNKVETPLPPDGGTHDRAAINRAAARVAFVDWQAMAATCGLTVPRESSFQTFGRKMAARMFEHASDPKGEAEMIAVWRLALANVERSSFLRGLSDRPFRADLKFLCQRESFARLIDGGYGNGAHAGGDRPSPPRSANVMQDALNRMKEKFNANT